MTTMRLSKHDLSADDVLAGLAVRYGPYYQPIAKTRHLGYRKGLNGDEWYARIRTRAGGYYRRRLGWAVSPTRPAGLMTRHWQRPISGSTVPAFALGPPSPAHWE